MGFEEDFESYWAIAWLNKRQILVIDGNDGLRDFRSKLETHSPEKKTV